MVKNLPAMVETQVQSLGWEDPLEKGMETHFSILAWRITWSEEPGGLESMGSQRIENVTGVAFSLLVIRNNSEILVCSAQILPMVFPKLSYSI